MQWKGPWNDCLPLPALHPIAFNGNGRLCNAWVKGAPPISNTVTHDHQYLIHIFEALCLEGLYILSELDRTELELIII